ncbi:MAG: flagellar export chaperone FliS [Gammaproteobacteria bacterium]|nr:flagellar export chaperone FliS [Gammaproteobacteria bacterium]
MPRPTFKGISQYRNIELESSVASASPHKLIEMLLDGALGKIQMARGCMERKEIGPKCAAINWSLSIIEGLYSSLNMAEGGDIALGLSKLYEYMMRRLVAANAGNEVAILDEVTQLLGEVRTGWVAIRR